MSANRSRKILKPLTTTWRWFTRKPLLESESLLVLVVLTVSAALFSAWYVWGIGKDYLVILYATFMSLVTFVVFAIDKWRATQKWRRVSEFNLIALSFLGGAIGAIVGVTIFRNKTRELKFRICVPISFIWNVFCLFWLFRE